MSRAFEQAWAFLMRDDIEGGARISDDPDDPGGLTRWGISQRAYPDEDIRNLTEARAKELFRRDYWEPCHCDDLPAPIAIAFADSAFNQGVGTAIKLLQKSLGVKADGVIGPITRAAANNWNGDPEAVNQFLSHRLLRYANGQTKYRRGWFLRVLRLKDATGGS
jgi:lysozyme family protein